MTDRDFDSQHQTTSSTLAQLPDGDPLSSSRLRSRVGFMSAAVYLAADDKLSTASTKQDYYDEKRISKVSTLDVGDVNGT